jgi:glycosyltransferase involved in cell wall biosynthesis
VPNGWDPTITDGGESDGSELDPGKVTLVHTGKLVGVRGRHPAGLFAGMWRLRERDPDAGDDDEQCALDASGVNGMVRHLGHLTREQSTALQRCADALLLLTSTRLSWEAPGKLFEYLLADRPIMALAAGAEAGRIVAATGTGAVVPPDDADAIADVLGRLVDGHLKAEYAPHGLDRFVHPAPARQMAAALDAAVAARADHA